MFVNGRNAQLSVNEKADEPSPFFRPIRWLTIKPGFLQGCDVTFHDIVLIKFIREAGVFIFISRLKSK